MMDVFPRMVFMQEGWWCTLYMCVVAKRLQLNTYNEGNMCRSEIEPSDQDYENAMVTTQF